LRRFFSVCEPELVVDGGHIALQRDEDLIAVFRGDLQQLTMLPTPPKIDRTKLSCDRKFK
jgi:hypothetical protein